MGATSKACALILQVCEVFHRCPIADDSHNEFLAGTELQAEPGSVRVFAA
jgi:hypothetical protein